MEKEVVCYLYKFTVNLYNGDKTFYFVNKDDAKIARFIIKKDYNNQNSFTKDIDSIISPVRKIAVMEKDLDKFGTLSSYEDFENCWFEITNQMCEESLTK